MTSAATWLSFLTCGSIILNSDSFKVELVRGHSGQCNRFSPASSQHTSKRNLALHASGKDKIDAAVPPPPANGRGEWADWDTDGYVEEPYEADEEPGDRFSSDPVQIPVPVVRLDTAAEDDAIVPSYEEFKKITAKVIISEQQSGQWSPLSSGKKGEPMGMSASDNWAGWSEDAAYFDEDDSQDDEGNWGRSEGADKPGYGAVSGSSDLWSRQTPTVTALKPVVVDNSAAVTTTPSITIPETVSSIPTSSSASLPAATAVVSKNVDSKPDTSSGTLTVVLEMNRQFANLDLKLVTQQNNYERKIDILVEEVGELKKWLGFIGGSLLVILLKIILNP
jgi:hypothetical protein